MTGNVKVQNLAPAMLDHEQTIQQVEGDGRNSEEVERYEHFAMVPKEGRPTPSGVATAVHSSKIARDTRSEISNPSFSNSPWIFGAPQPEFSCASRRIRSRSSLVIFGLPGWRRERQRQYQRKPARCQATTVPGFT